MNKLKYIAAVAIAIAGFGLQQAKADFNSTLNVGNDSLTGAGFFGPYGTVNVSLSGDTATITFTALNSFSFGGAQAVDVEVNGAFTTGTITENGAGTFSFAGSNQVDGFGVFNLTIDASDGRPDSATFVQFTITANSPGQWSDASQVLAFNSGGGNGPAFDAAAHIFAPGVTGFAGESPAGVPDGGTTVMLLGAALGALGVARRFLKC